jgi:Nif-specific regulatory protein
MKRSWKIKHPGSRGAEQVGREGEFDSTKSQQSSLDEKLRAVLKICEKMNVERELPALLDLIAQEASRLMDAEQASIFLLDRERNELWSIKTLDKTEIRFDARLGLAGAAVMTGQIINVKDAYQDPRFYKKIDGRTGFRTKSILVVPLTNRRGEVIGTFQTLNKKDGHFTERDEEVLQTLAQQVSIALETARLVEDLKHRHERLLKENSQFWKEIEGRSSTENIVGASPKIQNVVRLIEQISDSTLNVLITGESGTGKELVGKAIHYNSSRARSPFVAINCAALPESLVESELFGIEKGVATGVERRVGKFEEAEAGTLFLDEIGDLTPSTQAKILRALQEGAIERVGGRKAIPVDVRILSATNKNLQEEIKNGNFREDLYYRLRVIQIEMPSLREIPEDIPLLANYFLIKYCNEMKKEPKKFAPAAVRSLMNYAWPGNVRELENEIKRLIVLSARKVLTEEDLSEEIRSSKKNGVDSNLVSRRSLKHRVEDLEERLIVEALQNCRNNQKQAAKALGLSRQGLINKIKRYGIKL